MAGKQIDRRVVLRRAVGVVALIFSGRAVPALAPGRPQRKEASGIPTFESPMINLYSRDLARATSFYAGLGFVETFRTPTSGPPVHVILQMASFKLGIATVEAAKGHGLRPDGEGRWIEIVLWTEDTDAAVNALTAKGARLLSAAHDFQDGRLRSAWIADPDGNPIQLVQQKVVGMPR